MDAIVTPGAIRGMAEAPPSKSYTHRAIILAALAKGKSVIDKALVSDDTLYTAEACMALGAKIERKGSTFIVNGTGGELGARAKKVFIGNSGTTIRLMSSVAALAGGAVVFDGTAEMRKRPIRDLLDALGQLGVEAVSLNEDGCPPISISGNGLRGGNVSISGETSSQFLSSLLIACPYAEKPTRIRVTGGLKSKPYVDVTLDMMKTFGLAAKNNKYEEFLVPTGTYSARRYAVEGDYSSASYFFAGAAVSGSRVAVKGLNKKSVQGDKAFLDILKKTGCGVKWSADTVSVTGPRELKAVTVNMGDYPDLVPTLAATAAFARGTTQITNVGHLRFKETDRLAAPAAELRKAGVRVEIGKESMDVHGLFPYKPNGAAFETYKDHRMVMSLATLALAAEGKSTIHGAEHVSKSFPDFFQRMRKLGVKVSLK
ncbi:MAG: 3-phosphoshikimate 1-carboxyvinyltransferase [Candidatus Micrarchaeota archaeon]|nr:3-phosphoshikimate 1-carboxyvinyltransferase [Candidatus Micrarchaeota archaeon]